MHSRERNPMIDLDANTYNLNMRIFLFIFISVYKFIIEYILLFISQ